MGEHETRHGCRTLPIPDYVPDFDSEPWRLALAIWGPIETGLCDCHALCTCDDEQPEPYDGEDDE